MTWVLRAVPAEADELSADPEPHQPGLLLVLGNVLLLVVELAHCG